MKKYLIPSGAALLLALFVTGCESDDIAARTQEKSAAYATLQPWEKKHIEKGDIAVGFTPDMVYMAVGRASTVKHDDTSGSANTELWIYKNFYLPGEAAHSGYAPYNVDAPFQPSRTQGVMGDFNSGTTNPGYDNDIPPANGTQVPLGMGAHGTGQSIATAGAPQGTMEPADLLSYTLYVLFVDGKVVKFGVKANPS
jgi:hypothetical protein